MPSKPNLILAAVDNYGSYEIAPFLLSLEQTSFRGHICLFAGPQTSSGTVRKIRQRGVEIIRFAREFPFLPHPASTVVPRPQEPVHICNARYFLYYDYLLRCGDSFANVLITDVRDVFFQRDPFDCIVEQSVHFAMENPQITIGKCPWTASWIINGFGEEMLHKLKDKPMSCSGTTIAPVRLMKDYLNAMLHQIAQMKCAEAYLDQAAHNVLLHSRKLEFVTLLENFSGPILTAGSEPNYSLDKNCKLLNHDGSIIALIHQYDRHPQLAQLIDTRLRRTELGGMLDKATFLGRRLVNRIWRRLRQTLFSKS